MIFLPFIQVAAGRSYFETENGKPFLIIGHNEAMSWPGLIPLFVFHDASAAERHIRMLAQHGVTVIRLMLEYFCEGTWFFEERAGSPNPSTVTCWDQLIAICERWGVRILVVFWDTFHMMRHWSRHPYSVLSPSFHSPQQFCTSREALAVQKQRIAFFVDRWGCSGAVFGYELMNEIGPEWGGNAQEQFAWVDEIAMFTRKRELERWGKRHLLTVSCFGPAPADEYAELIFHHPALDFSTTHVYQFGVIDNPNNAIDSAIATARAVRIAREKNGGLRPYSDTENGPIHLFLDLNRQLPEHFDAEYFHNNAWAHLASGGAGSGMRWPFRTPHCLTAAMHVSQRSLARFSELIDWVQFAPLLQPLGVHVMGLPGGYGADHDLIFLGCADDTQAVLWILRDSRQSGIRLGAERQTQINIGELKPGAYSIVFWNTRKGVEAGRIHVRCTGCSMSVELPPFDRDLALAISRC